MRYIIVDVEATCWENTRNSDRMEIIEIGAVSLPAASSPPDTEFSRFVHPVVEPMLSDFCKSLTTITQVDVDAAGIYSTVFYEFLDWIGTEAYVFCSWGGYDLNQFRVDCQRHNMVLPKEFERHINLKKEFARVFSVRSCGMDKALTIAGLALEGSHHRGIDDARNIAKLAQLILPRLEAEDAIPA